MNNENLLFTRIALTGALGGIGKVVLSRLNKLGAHVIAIDILKQRDGEAALREIAPNNSRYISCDLSNDRDLANLQNTLEEDSYPDAIISLAGIVTSRNLENQSNEDIQRVLDTNLTSQIKLSRDFIKIWKKNRVKSLIIFTSSWVDHNPWPSITPYAASKAGLVALSRGIARENAVFGIRSNLISPGIVDVGMAAKQWREESDYKARAQRAIPLGRLQQPEEVADGIIFLLSQGASYMTGSNLLIDGGASLYPMDPEELR